MIHSIHRRDPNRTDRLGRSGPVHRRMLVRLVDPPARPGTADLIYTTTQGPGAVGTISSSGRHADRVAGPAPYTSSGVYSDFSPLAESGTRGGSAWSAVPAATFIRL